MMSQNKFAARLRKYIHKNQYKSIKDADLVSMDAIMTFMATFPGHPGRIGRVLGKSDIVFGEPIAFCEPDFLITTHGIYWAGLLAADPRGSFHLTWEQVLEIEDRIERGAWPYGMSVYKQSLMCGAVFWPSFIFLFVINMYGNAVILACGVAVVCGVLYYGYRMFIAQTVRLGRREMWWQAPSKEAADGVVDIVLAGIDIVKEMHKRGESF